MRKDFSLFPKQKHLQPSMGVEVLRPVAVLGGNSDACSLASKEE